MKALLAALLICLPLPSLAADTWIEGDTPHLRLAGNVSSQQLRDVGQDFERFRSVLRSSVANPDGSEPTVPVQIFVLASEDDLKELEPDVYQGRTSSLAGLCAPGRFADYIFVILRPAQALNWRSTAHIVYHEYHHLYFDRSAPWAPVWLREGLAELWGGVQIDASTADIGLVNTPALVTLHRNPFLPLETLLAVRHNSPEYQEWDRTGVFYSQSLLLTHYLLLAQPDGAQKLKRFGALLQQGVPQVEAFKATWGELAPLQSAFQDWVLHSHSMPSIRMTLESGAVDPPVSIHELSLARVLGLKAEVLAATRVPARALPFAEKSLALDPDDPEALVAQGLAQWAARERQKAQQSFEHASHHAEAGFVSHYLAALTADRGPEGWPLDSAKALRHFNRAAELFPRYAPALLDAAVLSLPSNGAAAISLARSVTALEPQKPALMIHAAAVLQKAGDKAGAGALVSQALQTALAGNDPEVANSVCWNGSLLGYASAVYAECEMAVSMAPNDWQIRDSRALARALTGNRDGAVEDFQFVLDHGKGPARDVRTKWIEVLKAGSSPFDRATLDQMLGEFLLE